MIPDKNTQRHERRKSMNTRRCSARGGNIVNHTSMIDDTVVEKGDEERGNEVDKLVINAKYREEDEELTLNERILKNFTSRPFLYGLMWVIWLIMGTIYYSLRLNLSVSKGFYQSVNVGYSVGWGDISENASETQIFSTVYVCIGASFVGAGLGFLLKAWSRT